MRASLGTLIAVTTLGMGPALSAKYNSVCAVFNGDSLIERNLCNEHWTARRSNGAEKNVREYRWKSGGKTVMANVEEWFQINGKEGETVFSKDGYELCVKNLSSGNIFCIGSR